MVIGLALQPYGMSRLARPLRALFDLPTQSTEFYSTLPYPNTFPTHDVTNSYIFTPNTPLAKSSLPSLRQLTQANNSHSLAATLCRKERRPCHSVSSYQRGPVFTTTFSSFLFLHCWPALSFLLCRTLTSLHTTDQRAIIPLRNDRHQLDNCCHNGSREVQTYSSFSHSWRIDVVSRCDEDEDNQTCELTDHFTKLQGLV
ncbi:hypothetical protein FOXG_18130 [Fusarium oxysporum f. sp. lycopersici 4287]|uniref:Uncharacterized protein n=2 Tax=Fusarium oxysporum TaxID=5507 RepID=A0A0J9UBS6_FUSO4|nr:hypothetical protein FOXG_18130 [Fusarium oxysporum f. sp. lycopersici 4287]EXK42848.1 hypothetical protein FOMG_05602 [Fusarium oxysporum f. sp. melonis 26406]KAJ9424839.1 hypothetical protein QL093DRAFT_1229914 [Fusarium oxysporum]KNA96287.1 hypothetical protein FOXG_18130 [Fusarium oxysporum f. sp. lycopersici 4287]